MYLRKDKIMVRLAGITGIVFASVYWLANHFYITEVQVVIAQFFYFWVALLGLVLAMYLLLIRALLKHIKILQHGYDPHQGKALSDRTDYISQYWSAIFEGAIISLIITTTMAGVSLSGLKFFLEKWTQHIPL